MEPKRKWLGPPTTFEAEVKIVSGGRVTIPKKILTAMGLEEGHTVLLHFTTTRMSDGRRTVEIDVQPKRCKVGDENDR